MRRWIALLVGVIAIVACEEEERVRQILERDGNADAGEDLFMGPCVECHRASGLGVDDPDNPGIGANLRETELSDAEIVATILYGRDEMPAFEDRLSNQQIANLLAFIREDLTN